MNTSEMLKNTRREIFEEIHNVNSPISLYNVQLKIANEIMEAEENYKNSKVEEYRNHINFLRNYTDSLVWTYFESHTIRQLYKNPAPPQSLVHQGEDFLYTLDTAKKLAEEGKAVLIADITNCIKIGDIIQYIDPERPIIIECKNGKFSPQKITSGRVARQTTRALHTLEYLNEGIIKNNVERTITVAIEIEGQAKYNWDIVNNTVNDAIKNGSGVGIIDNYDVIWAFKKNESDSEIPQEALDKIKEFKIPAVGCHLRSLEEIELLIQPPSCWPIDFECRFALMEGDIVLMHIIDIQRFTKINNDKGHIKEILSTKCNFKDYCFVVQIENKEKELSSRFINDVLYGFASIESIANQIIEFAYKSEEKLKITNEVIEEPLVMPKFKFVENFDDLEDLATQSNGEKRPSYVVLPQYLYEHIVESHEEIMELKKKENEK